MSICFRRREFITLLGGAAAWPLAARAQQGDRVRRIGVLMGGRDENDPVSKSEVSAFTQAVGDLGWTDGRNVRMDLRWAGGPDVANYRCRHQPSTKRPLTSRLTNQELSRSLSTSEIPLDSRVLI